MPSQFLKTTVILPIRDLYDALAWYERVLGFQTSYVHGNGRRGEETNYANYAIMNRDQVEVHFIMDESKPGGPQASGWQKPGNGRLGLTVSDVDAVCAQVKAAGATTQGEPTKLNWPARGFDLFDPDNNLIHIEQPT